jgi:putative aldouronate transport system permease protein
MAKPKYMRQPLLDIVFDIVNYTLMMVLIFITLYPFWNTIVISFNDAMDSIKGNLYFWPRHFTLFNYKTLFQTGNLLDAAWISISKTIIVTALNVFFSSMAAYILSHRNYVLRKFMTVFIVATMYVNAGLIPQYFLYRSLGLINNYLVYIMPALLGAFNVMVIRTAIHELPESLAESAKIDGAGEFRIFIQIIMPLCKPVLATIALWVAVGTWNSWFDTYIFASSKQKLSTLQYEMMKLVSSSMVQSRQVNPGLRAEGASNVVTPNSMRSAITIVASVPIIIVYPFLQKYFVKGLHLGGVKG